MKNLKRALSFALATVMVIGMMVVGAGAADFTDVETITNDEAVNVMVGLGVISGKPDGEDLKFDPTATLTRAEAAKIITYMLLGEEKAELLGTTGAKFTDVPAGHWAETYIGYCANMGIISGYNNEFNPTGELTGLAFGKMLLVALGYDAAIEGYTGTNDWGINVAVDMVAAGIDLGDDVVLDAALSRDNAAQMAFNTLTATLVKYSTKGTSINIGGVEITSGAATAEPVTYVEALGYDYLTGAEDASAGDSIQFCEKYFDNLSKSATAPGKFGRPTYTWNFSNDGNLDVTVEKEPTLTYVGKVTGGKLYTDMKKPATLPTITAVYVDGKDTNTNLPTIITSGNTAQITDDAGTPNNLTGAGVVTEIYKTAANTYTVCIINTYAGTINNWVKADINDDGEVVAKEYVEVAVATTKPGTLANSGKFETTAFEKADDTNNTVVYYTATWNGTNYTVKSVAAAEKVANVAVTTQSSTKINDQYTKSFKAVDVSGLTMTGGASYNLFLDSYGNVIDTSVYNATSKDYVMIAAMSSGAQGDATVENAYRNVKYVDMAGTQTVVKVYDNSGVYDVDGDALVTTKLYTVRDDEDHAGYYEFVAVTTKTGTAAATLNKNTPVITTSGDSIVANAETVFVLKTDADPVTYKVVTGVAALSSYESVSASAYAKVGTDGYADVVFIDVSGATPAATATKNVIFLLNKSADAYDAGLKKEYDVYNAIVDGVKTTVKVKNYESTEMDGFVNKLVEIKQLNADGFIEAGASYTAVVSSAQFPVIDASISGEVKYSAPALTLTGLGTYAVAEDVVVYFINTAKTDALTVGTPADLVCDTASGKVTFVCNSTTDATIKTIYFRGTMD